MNSHRGEVYLFLSYLGRKQAPTQFEALSRLTFCISQGSAEKQNQQGVWCV